MIENYTGVKKKRYKKLELQKQRFHRNERNAYKLSRYAEKSVL